VRSLDGPAITQWTLMPLQAMRADGSELVGLTQNPAMGFGSSWVPQAKQDEQAQLDSGRYPQQQGSEANQDTQR